MIERHVFGASFRPRFEFQGEAGLLGSHTIARKLQLEKDNVIAKRRKGYVVRWNDKGRVSDIYNDVMLAYPDANVAEKTRHGICLFLHL